MDHDKGRTDQRPFVSVVIPAYNRSTTIASALKSVQRQTHDRWETIVVDDGSTDDTAVIVEQFTKVESRVRLIRHECNRGAQAARNTGIRAARGEWIAFLDSDDEWVGDSLQTRLQVAAEKRVQVVYSSGYIVRQDGVVRPYTVGPPIFGRAYEAMLMNQGPTFPSLLVSRGALERIGCLDERIVSFQEWETAIRLSKYYEFAYSDHPSFIWHYHGAPSISKNREGQIRGYKQIVLKHFMAMLLYAGPASVARHCEIIVSLYARAGKEREGDFYKRLSLMLFKVDRAIGRTKHFIKRFLLSGRIRLRSEVR